MKLSICIPTRNRQSYCASAVQKILGNTGAYFELIVADNSDDADEIYRHLGAADVLQDPRLILIESIENPLSMQENWNRAIGACTGDWISFIGDDDYIDPKVGLLIDRIVKKDTEVDYFRWMRTTYNWPDNRRFKTTIRVELKSEVILLNTEKLQQSIIAFDRCGDGLTIYHAVVRRDRLESLRNSSHREIFSHPTVDYYNGWELAFLCKKPLQSRRTFSIAGASIRSNSAAVLNTRIAAARQREWQRTTAAKANSTGYGTFLLSGIIFECWLDYARDKNIKLSEEVKKNAVHLIVSDIKKYKTVREQELAIAEAKRFVSDRIGKEYLNLVPAAPDVQPQAKGRPYHGPLDGVLYLPDSYRGTTSAAEVYGVIEELLTPWYYVGTDLSSIKVL